MVLKIFYLTRNKSSILKSGRDEIFTTFSFSTPFLGERNCTSRKQKQYILMYGSSREGMNLVDKNNVLLDFCTSWLDLNIFRISSKILRIALYKKYIFWLSKISEKKFTPTRYYCPILSKFFMQFTECFWIELAYFD